MTASITNTGLTMVLIPLVVFCVAFVIGAMYFLLDATINAWCGRDMSSMFVILMGWSLVIGVFLLIIGAMQS